MKVLVLSRGFPHTKYIFNGIFEYDQAKALASIGHKVIFLALDFRSFWIKRKWGFFYFKKDNVHVFELSIPIGRYRKSISLLHLFLSFAYKRICNKMGTPDVIHSHFFQISNLAVFLKRKYKIPLVITEHSSLLNGDISKINLKLMKNSFKYADQIISVSPSLAKNIKTKFTYDSKIIYNIVDTDSFSFIERKQKKEFLFLSIGLLIKRKGFHLLIEAFKKADFDSNVFLNIVGEGKEYNYLQKQIDSYGLASQIKLLGKKNRTEIQEIMKKSDCFVLSSRAETFGVVYIEAMLTGLPVIATVCGGPENYLTEKSGILIEKDNVNALTKALKDMQKNAYNYNHKEISEYCYKKFSPQTIAEQITKVYHSLKR